MKYRKKTLEENTLADETTEEVSTSAVKTVKEKKKINRKKIIVLVVCAAILAACALFLKYCTGEKETEKHGESEHLTVHPYEYFEDPVWGVSLEENEYYEDYAELDRFIHYREGNVTTIIKDDNRASFPESALIFEDYFKALESGNADKYNSLFASSYFETNPKKEQFTPQMIYDILLVRKDMYEKDGVTIEGYDVEYKIFHNDGTFRKDVYSDAAGTLYIEVDDSEGVPKITSVSRYVESPVY